MNKILIFVLVLVGVGLIVFSFIKFFASSGGLAPGQSQPEATSGLPATGNIRISTPTVPQEDFISLGTPRGTVTVKNFYKAAIGAEEQFVVLAKNQNYEVNYDTYTSGFSIYVSAAPFDANRRAAEGDFLNISGVTEADACKLKVWVGAAPGIGSDESLGGSPRVASRGLSFCGRELQLN